MHFCSDLMNKLCKLLAKIYSKEALTRRRAALTGSGIQWRIGSFWSSLWRWSHAKRIFNAIIVFNIGMRAMSWSIGSAVTAAIIRGFVSVIAIAVTPVPHNSAADSDSSDWPLIWCAIYCRRTALLILTPCLAFWVSTERRLNADWLPNGPQNR